MSELISKEKILSFLDRIVKDYGMVPEEQSVARVLHRVIREGWFDKKEQ